MLLDLPEQVLLTVIRCLLTVSDTDLLSFLCCNHTTKKIVLELMSVRVNTVMKENELLFTITNSKNQNTRKNVSITKLYSLFSIPRMLLIGGTEDYRRCDMFNLCRHKFHKSCGLALKRYDEFDTVNYCNIVFAISGSGESSVGTVEAYNIITDSWLSLSPLPTKLTSIAAVAVDRSHSYRNRVSSASGSSSSSYVCHSPTETRRFSHGEHDSPSRVCSNSYNQCVDARCDRHDSNDSCKSSINVYDWSNMASYNSKDALADRGSSTGYDGLYVVGGYDYSKCRRSDNIYKLEINKSPYSDTTFQWKKLATNIPSGSRSHHSSIYYHNILVIAGGIVNSQSTATNSVEGYCIENDEWIAMPSMNRNRLNPKLMIINDLLYVVGGDMDSTRQVMNSIEVYNYENNSWDLVGLFPSKRYKHASCSYQGKIYVFGGTNGKITLADWDCYDVASQQWMSNCAAVSNLDGAINTDNSNNVQGKRGTGKTSCKIDDDYFTVPVRPRGIKSAKCVLFDIMNNC